MKISKTFIFIIGIILAVLILREHGRGFWYPLYTKIFGKQTTKDVIRKYGVSVDSRLVPFFEKQKVVYPPEKITLIGLKDEKKLELWAQKGKGWVFIKNYNIIAAGGTLGPKLNEGDGQVPEGIYFIEYLNPNSSYHLSFKINYPNEFDKQKAQKDGRDKLGGDIFIHGKNLSIGCLAMGDRAIEELFVLIAKIGKENVKIIISPIDFRKEHKVPMVNTKINWLLELYSIIKKEINIYKVVKVHNA